MVETSHLCSRVSGIRDLSSVCARLPLNLTGLQSQHLPAATLERPQTEAAAGLQVRFAHRRPQDVQMSLET